MQLQWIPSCAALLCYEKSGHISEAAACIVIEYVIRNCGHIKGVAAGEGGRT